MNLRLFYRAAAVVIALELLVAVWGLAQVGLDARVPMHWDAAGRPNGFGPAWLAFLLMPAITLGLVGLFAVIPRVEPRRANLLRSSSAYVTVALAMLVLMLGIHVMIVLAGVGHAVPVGLIVGVGVGLLFIVLGNVMTTVRSNFMFGVRTPWTLSSDVAWDRTHRLVGRLWVVGGAAVVLASLLGSPELLVGLILLFVFGSLGVAFVYSYQVWKSDPNKRSMGGEA
jgi:uncharacterized membrane protein